MKKTILILVSLIILLSHCSCTKEQESVDYGADHMKLKPEYEESREYIEMLGSFKKTEDSDGEVTAYVPTPENCMHNFATGAFRKRYKIEADYHRLVCEGCMGALDEPETHSDISEKSVRSGYHYSLERKCAVCSIKPIFIGNTVFEVIVSYDSEFDLPKEAEGERAEESLPPTEEVEGGK